MVLPEQSSSLATARIIRFDRIDSTNNEARRLAQAGCVAPAWIVADEQTAGRGRHGNREWLSPAGNLHATVLISLPVTARFLAPVSLVVALAIHDTITGLISGETLPELKWPNDVLLSGKKVSGNLIEVMDQNDDSTMLAIGCGINLAHAPDHTRFPAGCLSDYGSKAMPDECLALLARELDRWLDVWDAGQNLKAIRRAWCQRCRSLGQPMRLSTAAGQVEGIFLDIGDMGALMLKTADGAIHEFYAGDVQQTG